MKMMKMMKMMILTVASGVLLTGCAPSAQFIELKTAEVARLSEEKIAIINGYYGKRGEVESKEEEEGDFFKENTPLLPSEGDGGGIPCSIKCIDNCDDQCRKECQELWVEMCGEDEAYAPPPTAIFDWGEKTVDQSAEIEEPEPRPDSVVSKNNASGDNNNQTNVTGSNNKVLVQGGGRQNDSPTHPIEQAMAGILRSQIAPLKSNAEVIGEQVRGLIGDTADAIVKVAPAALTGAAIVAAGSAAKAGFEAAGDRYELTDSNNPDYSDHRVNYNAENEVAE